MNFRILSKYDVAQNFLYIISQSAKNSNKAQNSISAASKNIPVFKNAEKAGDVFIKNSEKVKK